MVANQNLSVIEALRSEIESVPTALVICDRFGRIAAENSGLRNLVKDEPEFVLLLGAIRLIAAGGPPLARCPTLGSKNAKRGPRRIETTWWQYSLQVSRLRPSLECLPGASVVAVSREHCTAPGYSPVSNLVNLTYQELRVAAMLSDGLSNPEIIAILGVSAHTARRHIERVLHKLDVHLRGKVRGKIAAEPQLPNQARVSRTDRTSVDLANAYSLDSLMVFDKSARGGYESIAFGVEDE